MLAEPRGPRKRPERPSPSAPPQLPVPAGGASGGGESDYHTFRAVSPRPGDEVPTARGTGSPPEEGATGPMGPGSGRMESEAESALVRAIVDRFEQEWKE